MASDSRERMVISAVQLLRERGYSGTGFREVVAHSGAPRGSIYHHFPGGKAQLGEEAVREFGRFIRDGMVAVTEAYPGDPVAALNAFLGAWRQLLEADQFRAGCPVVAVGVEVHDEAEGLTKAVAEVFEQWQTTLAEFLVGAAGVPMSRAMSLATLAIASVEGAVVMCQTRRDTQPLDEVGVELELVLRSVMKA